MSVYEKLFAHSLAFGDDAQHRIYGDRKRQLFAGLEGTVVEIGPGTGVNLPYLPDTIRWIGLEPNIHMHGFLREQLRGRELTAEIHSRPAQDTGLPSNCADVVISTLVLCSVPSVTDVLWELRRLLRPGGELRFIEHVAAPEGTWLRSIQRGLRPLWTCIADGCHPDRETGRLLAGSGCSSLEYDRFPTGLPVVSPHIIGRATLPPRSG